MSFIFALKSKTRCLYYQNNLKLHIIHHISTHMNFFFILLITFTHLLTPSVSKAQSFKENIEEYRTHYRDKFLNGSKSLLKEEDLKYLRFYEPDSTCRIQAVIRLTPDAQEFKMPTYSGLERPYIKYGILSFHFKGKNIELSVYKNLMLKDNPAFVDYLFIPFKDATNGNDTYGGGRYLELRLGEFKGDAVVLDFNKCYNPYCAYSEGFNCPIPPFENHLKVKIEAGEKVFAKSH